MAQSLYFFMPRAEREAALLRPDAALPDCGGASRRGAGRGLSGSGRALLLQPRAARTTAARWRSTSRCLIGAYPLEISLTSQGKTTRHSAVATSVSDSLRALAMVVPSCSGYGLHGMMVAVAALRRRSAAWPPGWCSLQVTRRGRSSTGSSSGSSSVYAAPFGAAMVLADPAAERAPVRGGARGGAGAVRALRGGLLPAAAGGPALHADQRGADGAAGRAREGEGRLEEAVLAFREAAAKLAFVFLPCAAFLFAAAPEFIARALRARSSCPRCRCSG